MRIYTRGGDKGETGLFDGTRVPKSDLRVEAYGTVDELNSLLSLARLAATDARIGTFLERIQDELFTVGADLATPESGKSKARRVSPAMVESLEADIDHWMGQVGNPAGFVVPGASEAGAHLHVARTVCRRAERRAVEAQATAEAVRYLNRLSDALYAAAVWTDQVAAGAQPRRPTYSGSSIT